MSSSALLYCIVLSEPTCETKKQKLSWFTTGTYCKHSKVGEEACLVSSSITGRVVEREIFLQTSFSYTG